jgi:GAF domain-containing protein
LDLFQPSRLVIITEIAKDERLTPAVRDLLLEGQIQTLAIFPLVALGNWLGCLLVFFPHEKRFEPVALRHIKYWSIRPPSLYITSVIGDRSGIAS